MEEGWRCSSGVGYLSAMCEVWDLIPGTTVKRKPVNDTLNYF